MKPFPKYLLKCLYCLLNLKYNNDSGICIKNLKYKNRKNCGNFQYVETVVSIILRLLSSSMAQFFCSQKYYFIFKVLQIQMTQISRFVYFIGRINFYYCAEDLAG